VLEQVCGCISNLSTECQENKTSLGEAEACESVVRILRRHSGSMVLVIRACNAVWNLASNNSINKIKLGADGACEVVVQAMKTHVSHQTVVGVCNGALKALSTGNSENADRITAAGGVVPSDKDKDKPVPPYQSALPPRPPLSAALSATWKASTKFSE
jgi:hypothetical protein